MEMAIGFTSIAIVIVVQACLLAAFLGGLKRDVVNLHNWLQDFTYRCDKRMEDSKSSLTEAVTYRDRELTEIKGRLLRLEDKK